MVQLFAFFFIYDLIRPLIKFKYPRKVLYLNAITGVVSVIIILIVIVLLLYAIETENARLLIPHLCVQVC